MPPITFTTALPGQPSAPISKLEFSPVPLHRICQCCWGAEATLKSVLKIPAALLVGLRVDLGQASVWTIT